MRLINKKHTHTQFDAFYYKQRREREREKSARCRSIPFSKINYRDIREPCTSSHFSWFFFLHFVSRDWWLLFPIKFEKAFSPPPSSRVSQMLCSIKLFYLISLRRCCCCCCFLLRVVVFCRSFYFGPYLPQQTRMKGQPTMCMGHTQVVQWCDACTLEKIDFMSVL